MYCVWAAGPAGCPGWEAAIACPMLVPAGSDRYGQPMAISTDTFEQERQQQRAGDTMLRGRLLLEEGDTPEEVFPKGRRLWAPHTRVGTHPPLPTRDSGCWCTTGLETQRCGVATENQ